MSLTIVTWCHQCGEELWIGDAYAHDGKNYCEKCKPNGAQKIDGLNAEAV